MRRLQWSTKAVEQWSDVRFLSANVNGIRQNGHLLVDTLVSQYDVVCLQETKLRSSAQQSRFTFHVTTRHQHHHFLSNFQPLTSSAVAHSRAGVATFLSPRFPGACDSRVLDDMTVPGRYIVVATSAKA